MAWMSERGYWPTRVPGIGCEGLRRRACQGIGSLPSRSSPEGMRVRSPRELVAAQGVLAVRICRAAHVTARVTHQIQVALPCLGTVMSGCVCRSIRFLPDGGVSHCLETKMPGCVCPVMRRTPDGGFLPLSGDLYVGLCMSGHAQPAEHGPALPYSVDICSASHAAAYRTCTRRPER